jgi:hypothetical protein
MLNRTTKVMAAVAVLAAVLVGGAYVAARTSEDFFRARVEAANWMGGSFSVVSYERGLFGATAETEMTRPRGGGKLRFAHRIRYGLPELLSGTHKIHSEPLLGEADARIGAMFGGKAPFTVESVFMAGGRQRHHFVVNEIDFHETGFGLSMSRIDGEFTVSGEGDEAGGQFGLPSLSVDWDREGSEYAIRLKDAAMRFEGKRAADHAFWTGVCSASVDEYVFEIDGPRATEFRWLRAGEGSGEMDKVALVLEKLGTRIALSERDGAVELAYGASVGSLRADGEPIVSDAGIGLVFENVDAGLLDDAVEMFALGAGTDPEAETRLGRLLAERLMKRLPAVLERRPAFLVRDTSARFAEGEAKLALRLAYVGGSGEQFDPAADIEGETRLSVPRALLARLPSVSAQSLDGLVASGLAVEKEGMLDLELSYRSGSLVLNGKPLPLKSLPGLLWQLRKAG